MADTTAQPAELAAPFVITATNARGEALTIDGAPEFRAAGGVWLDRALYGIRSGRTADGTTNRVHAFRVTYGPHVAELVREGDDVVDVRTGREIRRASLAWSLVNGRDLVTNAPAYGARPGWVAATVAALDAPAGAQQRGPCAACGAELFHVDGHGFTHTDPAADAACPPVDCDGAPIPAEPAAELPADVEPAPLVVIACGRDKLPHAAEAGRLYTGQQHRLARKAADAVAARIGGRVLIVSALHGLLELADVVEPYDVTIGDASAVAPVTLAAQLARTGARSVVALTPKRYTAALAEACATVGAELVAPLDGTRSIFEQRSRLADMARGPVDWSAAMARTSALLDLAVVVDDPEPVPAGHCAEPAPELVEDVRGQFALSF